MTTHIVWLKRDLRISDHAPLSAVLQHGEPVIVLYVVEPDYWQLPDTSARQWRFIRQSLLALEADLQPRTQQPTALSVYHGHVIDALQHIQQHCGDIALYSHEETGNDWTFQRDRAVKQWCRQHHVRWQEFAQFGVLRPNPSRDHWAKHWQQFMSQPRYSIPNCQAVSPLSSLSSVDSLPQQLGRHFAREAIGQIGGAGNAWGILNDFLQQRGEFYRGNISAPQRAQYYCSRLSPYLAYGCLGLRELVQTLWQAKQEARSARWQQSLAAVISRLWWHCHFIQKLEDQPDMEWRNLHPAYDELRTQTQIEHLLAWQEGRTGWPMVDACMRFLQTQGWLNFRMRALLLSTASYPLWLPWQAPAHHLARLFIDYEPGIHYPQVQMQAGTTGINIPRMYNPTRQAEQFDPDGQFIRQWLPELRQVPTAWIHQPWLLTSKLQQQYGVIIGRDYPAPLVDFTLAIRHARAQISALKTPVFRQRAQAIGEQHGSRKGRASKRIPQRPKARRSQRQVHPGQGSLFDD
ncbi:MAG: deoxyribodipyrimidine photo-lyase [Bacterioplanes sp.]|nr:deoxyribodipyrimidine photo-lyase [Bacterioplanes sp.]